VREREREEKREEEKGAHIVLHAVLDANEVGDDLPLVHLALTQLTRVARLLLGTLALELRHVVHTCTHITHR
jgi:hypothetical protein